MFSVLPVDEAERAAEQLLGPYTADEHSKRRVVVREARLNRAYVDPALQPAERADPDAGKKKRVRGPEELETGGPISAVPLRAVGVCVAGEVAVGAPGPPPRKTSRVPVGPLEAVGSASSSAASLAVSPRAGVGQMAAGSFAIASLNLDEVSGGLPRRCMLVAPMILGLKLVSMALMPVRWSSFIVQLRVYLG